MDMFCLFKSRLSKIPAIKPFPLIATRNLSFGPLKKIKSIAIVGIGGVGGYYGGKFALAAKKMSLDVSFVARGESYNALQQSGLNLITADEKFLVRPPIVRDLKQLPPQDLIILATKTNSLNDVLQEIVSIPHQNTYVMTLLNGVGAGDRLRKIIPAANVIDGCAYIFSHATRPGVVQHFGGPGEILFGSRFVNPSKLQEIEVLFRNANISAAVKSNMDEVMWQKYLFICPLSCMFLAYSLNVTSLLSNKRHIDLLKQLITEMVLVAEKKGIYFPADIVETIFKKTTLLAPALVTSMQWDLQRGRPLETEIFPGYILDEAARLSVAIPAHKQIFEKLQSLIFSPLVPKP